MSTVHFLNFCLNISYTVSFFHIIYQLYIKNYIQFCIYVLHFMFSHFPFINLKPVIFLESCPFCGIVIKNKANKQTKWEIKKEQEVNSLHNSLFLIWGKNNTILSPHVHFIVSFNIRSRKAL